MDEARCPWGPALGFVPEQLEQRRFASQWRACGRVESTQTGEGLSTPVSSRSLGSHLLGGRGSCAEGKVAAVWGAIRETQQTEAL